jgi:putative tryptophan/tyrosine transport system substrate-binding protein
MRRREFIAAIGSTAAVWPVLARAQQGEQVRRVGVLFFAGEAGQTSSLQKLYDELQKLGWVEGRNLRLDFRFGAGDIDRTRAEAADLVMRLAPDVIVPGGRAALVAAQQATKTIPIVFMAGDVAENGFVKNVAHPKGNATGFATAFGSLAGKWLQLLKEAAPNVTRVAVLGGDALGAYKLPIEAAARALGVQLVTIPVTDDAGIKAAIESFAAEPNGGLLPRRGIRTSAQRAVIRLAEQHRLPAIYGISSLAAEGGLMSYDSDLVEAVRGAASYVDRILRGAKVSELPVQYPTKFRLVVNLKTAKAIGITFPAHLIALADEVIE